ncbi:hypothetical protein DSO57_1009782 [Entomophthora muscae]|uniref:Uncharacterized protein n=1 Tax=Entomophthora muscae TaxID=34485 RepID=A0ACC2S8V3_9FUNG|nr:hypothetical protein DSO57_1009782 [Entomophthora muscae]
METDEHPSTTGSAPSSKAALKAQAPGPDPASNSNCPDKSTSFSDAVKQAGIVPEKHADAICYLCGLVSHQQKAASAENLTLVYVGGIQCKAISKVKKNLLSLSFDIWSTVIANISFLGASTCEFLLAPHYVSYFKRHITELDHLLLCLLENFEVCKAADLSALLALKEHVKASFINCNQVLLVAMMLFHLSKSFLRSTWLITLFQHTSLML